MSKIENIVDTEPSGSRERQYRGPLKNRSCTDIPCLVIFLVFIIGWISIGIYAFIHGDVDALIAPRDSVGRKCGLDPEVEKKPYLVFFDLTKCIKGTCNTPQVCQPECPNTSWFFPTKESDQDLHELRNSMLCEDTIDLSQKNFVQLQKLINTKTCAPWYLKSKPILKRCFPTVLPPNFLSHLTNESLAQSKIIIDQLVRVEGMISKAKETGLTIFLFLFGSMLICLLYITLLRWLALPCIWIGIALLTILLGCLGYLCWTEYSRENGWGGWLGLTIVLAVVASLAVVFAFCLYKRIRLACKLITEGGIAVINTLTSLFFPIIPWLIHLTLLIYFISVGINLKSIGEPEFRVIEKAAGGNCECDPILNYSIGSSCIPKDFYKYCTENNGNETEACISMGCHLERIISPSYIAFFYAIHIIGFLWFYCFITDLGGIILAATFATWYWTFNKKKVPWFNITVSAWRTFRYHLGTVAFGSLLITICKIFKMMVKILFNERMRQNPNCDRFCKICYEGTKCLLKYLEKFLKFVNRNAYIVCAITGKGLNASATDALSLIVRNAMRVFVLNNVVDVLLFLGKFVVTCMMVAASWWYWKITNDNDDEYWWLPVLLVGIGTYLVANLFFGVHAIAVDTIFLCFLEDCEINDGSAEKPYYMSKRLEKILKRSNL